MIEDIHTSLDLLEKLLRNLGPETSKLLRPAPEGYKYEVQLVRKAEVPIPGYDHTVNSNCEGCSTSLDPVEQPAGDEALDPGFLRSARTLKKTLLEQISLPDPVPVAPYFPAIPFDPTKKYEYKGLTCDKHEQQAHRRERNATGPWTCTVCIPAPFGWSGA